MEMTEKQGFVLENLDRVVVKEGGRQSKYSLDGRNCRMQIASLAVQGFVTWDGKGTPSKITKLNSLDAGARVAQGVALASVPNGSELTPVLPTR